MTEMTHEEMLEEAERREKMNRLIKNPDEIILEDIKLFHYEVMASNSSVWIGIYTNQGKIYHLHISGKNLRVNYSDETC